MTSALSSALAPRNQARNPIALAGVGTLPAARPLPVIPAPPKPAPRSMAERMTLAKERIEKCALNGERVRSYEVALDLDMSEFHFARQFRAAFGRSPHVFYDEVRAKCARKLLCEGLAEGEVARRIGFRRPAELRALLAKRTEQPSEEALVAEGR